MTRRHAKVYQALRNGDPVETEDMVKAERFFSELAWMARQAGPSFLLFAKEAEDVAGRLEIFARARRARERDGER